MSKRVVKIWFSEEDLSDMMTSFHKEEGQLWNTWSPYLSTGEIIDVEMYTGSESEEGRHLICSNSNCENKIYLGEEFQHDKNYNAYCTDRECTDGIKTWMANLEKCWWDEQEQK